MIDNFGCINNTIKVAAGHYVDLANPDPATIDIESIAAALSKICRFGGHCPRFYSVAEHCIHAARLAVADGLPPVGLLAVLLHDAAEAYIGDMVKPLKMLIPRYRAIETSIECAIESSFGVDFQEWAQDIKRYDRAMLKAEKIAMWPDDNEQWAGFSEIEAGSVTLMYWRPFVAEVSFLDEYRILSKQRSGHGDAGIEVGKGLK